jgi:hypothetical protein
MATHKWNQVKEGHDDPSIAYLFWSMLYFIVINIIHPNWVYQGQKFTT